MQKSVPTPESPDNSTKHISDEDETDTSAKKKPSSGNDRVSISNYCSFLIKILFMFSHFILGLF